MTTPAQYADAVDKTVTNANRLNRFINGTSSETVTTDNGPIPTLAKLVDQVENDFSDAAIDSVPGLRTDLNSRVKTVDLASTAAGKGTSLVGHTLGGNVAQYLNQYSADAAGCVGDGTTDDTAALQAVCSIIGAKVRLSPGKIYKVGNLTLADNVSLISESGRGYTAFSGADIYNGAILRMKSDAQCLLNVNNKRGVSLTGLVLDGVDRTAPCVSSGSVRLNVVDCRMINGSYGVGGAVDGGSSYTRVMHMRNTVIASNTIGLRNLIDSFVFGGEVANNGTNLSQSSGSNSCIFTGVRFEWPIASLGTGQNVRIVGVSGSTVSDNNFIGCQIDRGDAAGVHMDYASGINFVGGFIRRSNASASTSAPDNCLINIQSSDNISISAVTFNRGADDGGTGSTTPDYVVNFNSACDKVVIQACTVKATTFTAFARNTANCTNLTIDANPGVADICTDVLKPQKGNGSVYRDRKTGTAAGSGGTTNLTLSTRNPIGTFDNSVYEIAVSARDATTGSGYSAIVILHVRRESGNASTGGITVVGQTTASFFGVGTGTLQLSTANVATDGSSFDLVVTNTATNSMQMKARLNL